MRSAIWIVALVACGGPSTTLAPDGSDCRPACDDDLVCRHATCVAAPIACTSHAGCPGDQYCDAAAMECLPWGVGPGGESDATCHSTAVPGALFPELQCAWSGPPAGDSFPDHVSVLATAMVASFEDGAPPSIVFPSYNGTDRSAAACRGSDGSYAVLRVIDGATCRQQATLALPRVIATSPVAIANLAGSAAPEIIAARDDGGLVAFTRGATGWSVLWQTASRFTDQLCDWAGPSVHDLDDDGSPEIVLGGAVFDGATGALIDDSISQRVDSIGVGYIPVVADVDADGAVELITGTELYAWQRTATPTRGHWVHKLGLAASNGQVAVADLGTFPEVEQADRSARDGVAEIAIVIGGEVRVRSAHNRGVFEARLKELGVGTSTGGPLALADFDGDGRIEIAAAAGTALNVLDPDCREGQPSDRRTCASLATDGVLWAVPSHGDASDAPGVSAFDLDGDGRAELLHADRCFSRVYDGVTGDVLYSRARTGCRAYEYPVVADVDGDRNAELVVTSSRACAAAPPVDCPVIDPLFDGVRCADDTDCAIPTVCARDAGATIGRCRCAVTADCGDGLVCADPIAGPSPAGRVCRAGHPRAPITGIAVIADRADRWRDASGIWNQHAFSITNVDAAGAVPRTSAWPLNWTQRGLNSFRAGSPAAEPVAGATPDLSVRQAKATCDGRTPTVVAEVCNRGSAAVAAGVPVAVYTATTPSRLRCESATVEPLAPGGCTTVSCVWSGTPGDGAVVVDDRGDGTGVARECREDNNALDLRVACP